MRSTTTNYETVDLSQNSWLYIAHAGIRNACGGKLSKRSDNILWSKVRMRREEPVNCPHAKHFSSRTLGRLFRKILVTHKRTEKHFIHIAAPCYRPVPIKGNSKQTLACRIDHHVARTRVKGKDTRRVATRKHRHVTNAAQVEKDYVPFGVPIQNLL